MKTTQLILFILLAANALLAQDTDRKIEFPDVVGYKTLKTDLHIHTVFSDGYVWPNIRVEEAVKDGLDAISLTEHIEYQPKKDDIPHKDRNRSFEIAAKAAKPFDLIVIHGTEITRSMPPGHANALFVTDVNKIVVDDAYESYKAARAQGAFIFWNHPHWLKQKKDGLPKLTDMHKKLIKEDLLHGMEIVNDLTFSEAGMEIAQKNNLAMIGTSDVHGLVDYQYEIASGGHRPITLVFSKERTEAGIKEALFAGRTITWFDNILAGNESNMKLLLDACISTNVKGYIGDSEVTEVVLKNVSDAKFVLHNTSNYDFHKNTDVIELLPHSEMTIEVITSKDAKKGPLTFEVLNAKIAYKKNYSFDINIK